MWGTACFVWFDVRVREDYRPTLLRRAASFAPCAPFNEELTDWLHSLRLLIDLIKVGSHYLRQLR